MTPWDHESESRINSRTCLGQFVLVCFPVWNLYWQVRFAKKTHSIWSIWAPRALFVIYTPHISSHQPVLDFHTQITSKYSTAMCIMCSSSDQRSQNNMLWSMKGVESLRMQSFKRFWKSRDREFEKIPRSREIPGSRRSLVTAKT